MSKTPSTEEILADIRNKLKMANEKIKTSTTPQEELNADELEDNTMEALDEIKAKLNDEDDFKEDYTPTKKEYDDLIVENEEETLEEQEDYDDDLIVENEENEEEEQEDYDDDLIVENEEETENIEKNELSIDDIINKYKNLDTNYTEPKKEITYNKEPEVLTSSVITAISNILDEKLNSFAQMQNRFNQRSEEEVKISELIKDAIPEIMEKWMERNQSTVIKIISEVAERQISEAISKINKK